MTETEERCPVCGGELTDTRGLTIAEFRKAVGLCIRGECARERTIGRDPDGNVHNRVAPATSIAFVAGPRRSRLAR